MNIKLVVFDLGNVLFTFSVDRAFNYWAAKTGESAELLKSRFVQDEMYDLHEKGKITTSQYSQHVTAMLKISLSENDFLDGWNDILMHPIMPSFEVVRNVKEKGIQTAVLSNTNFPHTVILKEKYGSLFGIFDGIFFSNDIGFRKPEKDSFLHVINSLGADAKNSLMIDDLKENIIGAADIGMNTLHLEDYTALDERIKVFL
ncbi:MAG TPA: HAD family phosphatase [Spirochaetota bacterium]|nr:HAD family phosphatase [Spirochaetota bacterium]HOR43872.1 HAD family phosphatase [Spirochaetota bacterium]HOU83666.1 HAD family phosphatase [Spirochaetota bacterium]HPK55296.1 HAD family phosphatase [Spirochaetota bacterium]HQE59153.1 HAD family phosphatase [Spirochaetota bacterium]